MTPQIPEFRSFPPTPEDTKHALAALQHERACGAALVVALWNYRGRLTSDAQSLVERLTTNDERLKRRIDLELDCLNDLRDATLTIGESVKRYIDRYLAAVEAAEASDCIARDLSDWHERATAVDPATEFVPQPQKKEEP
jgi:hypothetical protein